MACSQGAAGPSKPKVKLKLEAAPGERRVRRIITYTLEDGSHERREMIFTDR